MIESYPGPDVQHGWPELRQLWKGILDRRATAWPPGRALEYLVIRAFELDGAVVRRGFSVDVDGAILEQLDGAIYAAGLHCLVECKDRREQLKTEPIAKLRNQLLRRPAGTVGLLFSTGGYHVSATTLARFSVQQPVLLWYEAEITYMLDNENPCTMLRKKYRLCVEEGKPESNLLELVP